MKGVIVYDTYYGNTKRVAEAIAEEIRAAGHEAELRNVRERYPSPPQGDFMFVGSPVRIARIPGRTRRFVKKIDREAWKNKPMAVFVTVLPLPGEEATEKEKADAEKWILSAGPKLRDLAKKRGLNVVDKVLYAPVKEMKGPLADNSIDLAKEYTQDFVAAMKR